MYQYLGYTVGDNVGLWLGKGYSISSDILRSWVRKSDDTGDKNKWQLLTSNSHLIIWYIKIDFISWLQKYSFRKMSFTCMETSQWANESVEQTPATHSFRHFKMYWHRESRTNQFESYGATGSSTPKQNLSHSEVLRFSGRAHYVSRSRRLRLNCFRQDTWKVSCPHWVRSWGWLMFTSKWLKLSTFSHLINDFCSWR